MTCRHSIDRTQAGSIDLHQRRRGFRLIQVKAVARMPLHPSSSATHSSPRMSQYRKILLIADPSMRLTPAYHRAERLGSQQRAFAADTHTHADHITALGK